MLSEQYLTPRLRAILEQVPLCKCLCDIGTDHAYIPIAAIDRKRTSRAFATDVHEGPVKRARENVAFYGLSDEIEVRLGNGLLPVLDTEPDVVVIAGMGGCLITEILQQQEDFVARCSRLVLQPMREADAIRRYAFDKGWSFTETLAQEERRYYHILTVHPQVTLTETNISEWDFKFGTRWLKRHPSFISELLQTIEELKRIEDGISGDKEQAQKRKLDCRMTRDYLQEVVKRIETQRD